jgi:hypothetical protein
VAIDRATATAGLFLILSLCLSLLLAARERRGARLPVEIHVLQSSGRPLQDQRRGSVRSPPAKPCSASSRATGFPTAPTKRTPMRAGASRFRATAAVPRRAPRSASSSATPQGLEQRGTGFANDGTGAPKTLEIIPACLAHGSGSAFYVLIGWFVSSPLMLPQNPSGFLSKVLAPGIADPARLGQRLAQ